VDLGDLHIKALLGRAEIYYLTGALKCALADYQAISTRVRSGPYRREALDSIGVIFGELGDYDREISCANRLVKDSRSLDLCSQGQSLIRKARALSNKGRYRASLKILERSVRLFKRAQRASRSSRPDRRTILENIARAYNSMGMAYNLQNRYASALNFYQRSLDLTEKLNNPLTTTQSLNNVGLVYWHIGRHGRAMVYFNRALKTAQKIGFKSGYSTILGNIGLIYNDLDKPKVALDYFLNAIAINREIGNQPNLAIQLNNAGLCFDNMCELDKSEIMFAQSLDIFRKIANKYGMAMVLNNIGMSLCERGEYQRAFECATEGEKIARAADIRETITRLYMLKAWILQIRKEYPAAIRQLKETIGLAEKHSLETQRIWAAKQYIETAIEANDRKYLAGISKHVALIEKAYRHEPFGKNKGLLLAALVDFDRFTRDYAQARKKLAVLQGIVRELKDPGLTIKALLVQAWLNRATGREYGSLAKKGKQLCRELGLVTLRNEFERMK